MKRYLWTFLGFQLFRYILHVTACLLFVVTLNSCAEEPTDFESSPPPCRAEETEIFICSFEFVPDKIHPGQSVSLKGRVAVGNKYHVREWCMSVGYEGTAPTSTCQNFETFDQDAGEMISQDSEKFSWGSINEAHLLVFDTNGTAEMPAGVIDLEIYYVDQSFKESNHVSASLVVSRY